MSRLRSGSRELLEPWNDRRSDMSREASMKDLARLLGLSVSTIGRSLDDRPEISDATKKRVRQAADSLGYVRNSGARMMRTRQSSLIGLVVPDLGNDFYSTAAMALSRCCEEAGYQLVLAATSDNPESELRQLRGLIGARVAGVVISPNATPLRETLALLERTCAVDFIRESGVAGRAWFGINGWQGLADATGHLLELGHRRIGLICGHAGLSTGRARRSGFRSGFERAGLPCPEDLIRAGEPDVGFGRAAMLDLLDTARPSAVIAADAELTFGMIEALNERRVAVPDEVSVMGFGDAHGFRWWRGGLTTMALPTYDIAYACGGYLLRRIEAQQGGRAENRDAQFRAVHELSLVLRASTRRFGGEPGRS
jgi:LacI family transcriptional regulator